MTMAPATASAVARIRNRCFEGIGDGSLGSIGTQRPSSLSVVADDPE
jgi:hypothetical protein